MRKLMLYTAVSLDGFIAREDGDISWLPSAGDYGYREFYSGISTMLMGSATFKKIISMTGVDAFPHRDREVIVFSKNTQFDCRPNAVAVSEDAVSFTKRLKQQSGGDIWLVGGGKLNASLQRAGLIDEYVLTYCPVLLGCGIPLFDGGASFTQLIPVSRLEWPDGVVQLHYKLTAGGWK